MTTTDGLRASDGDRDRVAELLHAAYSEGRITTDEHDERVEAAIRAKTFDDLMPLTADLIPYSAPTLPTSREMVARDNVDEPDRMTAALADVKREGKWRVRRQSNANVFLGSVKLDLTEATFEAPVVEVNVTQFLGSVFLRVPRGVTVRDETSCVLGEFTVKDIGDPDPTFPVIVIRGTNVLGDIKVRGPKKPSIWKRP